jgi:carboxylate-amine ligase
MALRQLGVEEEMLLTEPLTGMLTAVSDRALRAHALLSGESQVEQELFLEQIETATQPCQDLDDLRRELRQGRLAVVEAAEAVGASVVAVATPVLVDEGDVEVTPKPRYLRMMGEFGEAARDSIVCGMHIHVEVDGVEEAVAALDRIRPWLPVLLAMSANSPFWHGLDTGYSSWRRQVLRRWPSAGEVEAFGTADNYHAAVQDLLATGAAMDKAMIYFDARPSATYPTLEVRVCDVCTDVDDVALLAVLTRALVEVSVRSWARGEPVPLWRTDLLRAAHWRAARDGLTGHLIHPLTRRPAAARAVVEALCAHTHDVLADAGEEERVTDLVERLLRRGTGSSRQRAVMSRSEDLRDVVADLQTRTRASCRSRESQ